MKKFFLMMAMLTIGIAASAQQLYELKYYDRGDHKNYIGLFFFTSEEECYLRCVDEEPNEDGDYDYWDQDYESGFVSDDEDRFIYFVPKEPETEDGTIYPWFYQCYSDKGEFEGPAQVVFQNFNDDRIHRTNVHDCEYFREVDITQKDADYFLEFFNEDDEWYIRIMNAKERLSSQDRELDGQYTNSDNGFEGDVTMHFIVAAATKDESIGESVQTDLKLVRKDFSVMADQLNIGFDEQVIQGNSFTRSNIENAIRKLSVKPNDVVVFIYSGHGFRFDDDTDAYPRMYLTYDGDLDEDTQWSTTEAFNALVKKKARLTLFLSDCCNSKVGITRAEMESMAFASRAVNNNVDTRKLRQLFIEQQGTLRATAAKAGQYALCDKSGGFLLTSFLNNIKAQVSAISKDDPSWERIIENAKKAVAKKTSNQIDEAGNESEPQVVVRAIHINSVNGSSSSSNLSNEDEGESMSGSSATRSVDSADDGDLMAGLLCVGLPIIGIIILIIVIIKLLRRKKK